MEPVDAPGPNAVDALWGSALRRLRSTSGAAVGFGGSVQDGALRLTRFDGVRGRALEDLAVVSGRGVGGRVWERRAAFGVADYGRAADISHHYDRPVLSEGLRSVVAAPIVIGRDVRGVVYAGVRESVTAGDRLLDAVNRTGLWLARELAIEDEVNRRLAERTAVLQQAESAASERWRRAHAGLRELRASTTDAATRSALARLLEDLQPAAADGEAPALTPRETDVLTQVATGASYAQVGARLGIAPQTVKSYMRDLIARFEVHSRHEAVVAARRRGLLP
ncbi:helix-turn-helix transcriptional regulator [Nocardioides sambongensis]|uniref:helix-turn-helix transcriptional regulator n=1 Tax=Nocardioides sambongensis TaxID=2589074 RepID=UPI00112C43F7|nr:LuxR C-terminal-related transcriptional regulator [Nocardioides sambongensis]